MKKYVLSSAVYFILSALSFARTGQRYENLHNSTEFLFSSSESDVIRVLKDPDRKLAPPPEPLHGSYRPTADYVYGFGFMNWYTRRYWTGRREKDEDVDPPEAGRIGTIDGDFEVQVIPVKGDHTLVRVVVKTFQQQIGRRYAIFPHFHKTHVSVDVKSDTYFEYLFLLRLGELLGEKGMPPIKGRDD